MANINWITFNTEQGVSDIDASLRAVIAKRFGDPERLVLHESPRYGAYWNYNSPTHGGVGITLKHFIPKLSRKRIEFKPGADPQSEYAEFVFRNEMGVLYAAKCGGEYDPDAEGWEPNPAKYPTFEAYMAKFYFGGSV